MVYPGIKPADIYLPQGQDNTKWAVIACDQYTSQPAYWEEVERVAGDAPSALNIVQPEAYLDNADKRLQHVYASMREYLDNGILTKQVENGFVVTERTTPSGIRPGLVCAVDLEAYDFTPGNDKLIRATEGTVLERIPPRVKIRENAPLECPHIMVLIDDPALTVVEPLYEAAKQTDALYDFELMCRGGHLRGWGISGEQPALKAALEKLMSDNGGFLYAVGDGNHSLATAKACHREGDESTRYALVEIVNLHCPALNFEPIHRVLFGISAEAALESFKKYLECRQLSWKDGSSIRFTDGEKDSGIDIVGAGNVMDVTLIQPWLDEAGYTKSTDYIHGEASVREICREKGASGILLGSMDKSALFPSVKKNGVLPRKSFSMGEADEKRFYMECRLIK